MNILVATPGRLLQHISQSPNFYTDTLQILGFSLLFSLLLFSSRFFSSLLVSSLLFSLLLFSSRFFSSLLASSLLAPCICFCICLSGYLSI
jgi:hypothetical protein